MSVFKLSMAVVDWACKRAKLHVSALNEAFPRFDKWLDGTHIPSFRQLQQFATMAHIPVGYLFLDTPPIEKLIIPDRRTVGSAEYATPSLELLETIKSCAQRQDWYIEYLESEGVAERLAIVGACKSTDSVESAAMLMRKEFGYSAERINDSGNKAIDYLVESAEDAGVLVMMNSIVGNSTTRKLDIEEFRGFAISNDFAPVVFVNTNDSDSARLFTLAHELAHILLGESSINDPEPLDSHVSRLEHGSIEKWCNMVAGEFLVPAEELEYCIVDNPIDEISDIARRFSVSTFVIAHRLLHTETIDHDDYRVLYAMLMQHSSHKAKKKSKGGPSPYVMLPRRCSRRFSIALLTSYDEGTTDARDAMRLLGLSKEDALRNYRKAMLEASGV